MLARMALVSQNGDIRVLVQRSEQSEQPFQEEARKGQGSQSVRVVWCWAVMSMGDIKAFLWCQ